jgi:TDG/mug DNA glycosylase family protein
MEDTTEQSNGSVPPASFNGKLQQFNYDDATSVTGSATTITRRQTRGSVRGTSETTSDVSQATKVVKSRVTKTSTSRKKRPSKQYADPSKYAHLKPLTDILEPNLICVFVGFNPGVQTATAGHAYAHPSNLFWKLLHRSGCTDRQLKPEEDVDLPRLYAMGNTNLVSRPTKMDAELSKEEQLASVPILEAKIRRYRPEAVCIVGKSIWENIWKYRWGSKPSKTEFKNGWQDEKHNMGKLPVEGEDEDNHWTGARVFVATSTSGLDASTKPAQKEAIWQPFGQWVQERREERKAADNLDTP